MKIGKLNSSQDGAIFTIDGEVQTLSAGHGNVPKILINETNNTIRERHDTNSKGGGRSMSKKHSYDMIVIPANTKQGFEEVNPGDSVNFSVPNSKTRRGRVGKGVAQTLDTACNQGVIQVNPSLESGGKQPYQQNRIYDTAVIAPANTGLSCGSVAIVEPMVISNTNMNGETFDNDFAGTIRANASYNYQTVNRIRRLTEIECERLQGLPDNHTKFGNYDGVIKEISATQRYKMCGNGVSVPIVRMIAEKLFKENYSNGNLQNK